MIRRQDRSPEADRFGPLEVQTESLIERICSG